MKHVADEPIRDPARDFVVAVRPEEASPPLEFRDGTVTAFSTAGSYPSVTVTLGRSDGKNPISGVRYLAGYVPKAGDKVQIAKLGNDAWVVGLLQPSATDYRHDLIASAGDMLIGAGIDALARLAHPGAAGRVLKSTATSVAWSNEDTGWIAPTLLNGWQNFGSPAALAGYRKVNGIVTVRGVVKNGTANSAIFNLPAGYRTAPFQDADIPAWTDTGSGLVRLWGGSNASIRHALGGTAYCHIPYLSYPADE